MTHRGLRTPGQRWLVALTAVAVAVVPSCGLITDTPKVDIPDGIPPAPGAAVPYFNIDSPGRTANLLASWAKPIAAETGIPLTSLEAYGNAAEIERQQHPECGITWTTLAGIAGVESKHGEYRGATVHPDGEVTPPIRGVQLDGTNGNMTVADTDNGKLDGDPHLDRAVGPFQFLPETWERYGVDASGDGKRDPDNIDDAALTAARYLCVSGGDLTTAAGWRKAVLTYNNSRAYLINVRDHANAYGVGVSF